MPAPISPSKPQQSTGTLPPDFDVNRPQRGARDGYFYLFVELNKQYGEICNSMSGSNYDPRIKRKVRHMISTITDDGIRLYAWNLFDGAINNINTDPNFTTESQRQDAIMDMCDVILGEIWAYYDQFMGVTHRLRMGNARPPAERDDEPVVVNDEILDTPFELPEKTDVIEDTQ